MDPDGTCFIVCAVVNAVADTAIYLATTDSSEWSAGGIAGAAATGAVTGFLGVGLLSKVTKLLTKVPKATRAAANKARTKSRPTLAKPGQDLYVGPYSVSRNANIKSGLNKTHTPHHAPQHAVSRVGHGRGITINLRKGLHAQTRSFNRRPPNLATRRDHLAADVRDLRGILRGAGYQRSVVNRQLLELIRQNKLLWGQQ